jgi:ATP-dependent Clp protease ATP-binding subunit ClpB
LFKPLSLVEIEKVVDLMLNDVRRRLSDRNMTIEVTEQALEFIAEQGFDPVYGARPLRRFISHELETRIGRALIGGDARDGAMIRIGVVEGELEVEFDNPDLKAETA